MWTQVKQNTIFPPGRIQTNLLKGVWLFALNVSISIKKKKKTTKILNMATRWRQTHRNRLVIAASTVGFPDNTEKCLKVNANVMEL